MNYSIPETGFVRLNRVYGKDGLIPVSRACWYNWIAQGKVPAPKKIGPRCVAYRAETLREIIEGLDDEPAAEAGGRHE